MLRRKFALGQHQYVRPIPPGTLNWTGESLPDAEQFLLTRLDYLNNFTRRTHRRRAYAVLLKRDLHVVAP